MPQGKGIHPGTPGTTFRSSVAKGGASKDVEDRRSFWSDAENRSFFNVGKAAAKASEPIKRKAAQYKTVPMSQAKEFAKQGQRAGAYWAGVAPAKMAVKAAGYKNLKTGKVNK